MGNLVEGGERPWPFRGGWEWAGTSSDLLLLSVEALEGGVLAEVEHTCMIMVLLPQEDELSGGCR